MAIPKFYELMLLLLQVLSDGKTHGINEIVDKLALKFQLTQEEIEELLPSGKKRRFTDRVGWAKTYLKMGGLIDSPQRTFFVITDRGKKHWEISPKKCWNT